MSDLVRSRQAALHVPPAPDAEPTPEAESRLPRGSETILVVEDERAVRATVRRMLERLGYRVREAASGAEALGMLDTSREPIHLLLTDVVMPDIQGRQLVETALEQALVPRVLYMSGYTEDETLLGGLGAPDAALLQKPFTDEALAHAVRTALDD